MAKRGRKFGDYWTLGNSKLPAHTAIFNMGPACECPSRELGMCKVSDKCYAIKAERQYPQVISWRQKQRDYWTKCTAEDFVTEFMIAQEHKRSDKKVKYLRFSESGDYRSQDDVDKMERIARLLSDYGIKCYVYTARQDLDFHNVRYLTVMFSGFYGFTDGKHGQFKAVADVNVRPDNFGVCPGDCTACSRCVMGLNSVVKMH